LYENVKTQEHSKSRATDAPAVRRVLQRVFSFPTMLASVLVVLAFLTLRDRFDDPDMWWHLKIGETIWTTHHIPVTDLFSYTTNHHASIPHEWLAELTMYAAYRLGGGYVGLMLWVCLLASIFLVAGYWLCSLYSGNSKVGFAGAMIIWTFATVGLAIRPQLIGYIFLIFELVIIHLGRNRSPRWFFWLPVLTAVWVNCHGSFALGLVVQGIFLFSSFFSFKAGSVVSQRWDRQRQTNLGVALVLSMAATLLNPVGIEQIRYPIETMLASASGGEVVQEWQATQLTDLRGIALMAVLLCCFLLVAVRRSDLALDELLLLTAATWLGVSHMRMLFVFGILVAPILSRLLSTSWEGYDPAQDRIWPNAAFVALALLVVVLVFPSRKNLESQVERFSPVKAVQFIKTNHISGPMLNDWTDGGYLMWALPEHPVFIDGRGDVYDWAGVLTEFGDWATVRTDPNVLLEKYKINFCVLWNHSLMARVLPLLPNWRLVYSDEHSVIFVRTYPGARAGSEK